MLTESGLAHLIVKEWRKVIKAEKQDLEAMRRAALKFRNVGLSRALTTWAVWGAQRALYKQNAFLLASHHAGVVSQVNHTAQFFRFTPRNSSYSHPAFASSPSSCSSRGARPSSRTIGCATMSWSRCASRDRSTRSATSASASRRRRSRGGRRCG